MSSKAIRAQAGLPQADLATPHSGLRRHRACGLRPRGDRYRARSPGPCRPPDHSQALHPRPGHDSACPHPGNDRHPTRRGSARRTPRLPEQAKAMTLYGTATGGTLTSGGSNGTPPVIRRPFGLGREPRTIGFRCEECGAIHRGSPSFGFDRPSLYYDVPEPERDARIMLTRDTCFITLHCAGPGRRRQTDPLLAASAATSAGSR